MQRLREWKGRGSRGYSGIPSVFVSDRQPSENTLGADQAGLYFRRAELLSHNDQHELAAADYSRSWDLKPDEMTGARYASTLTIIGQIGKAIRLLRDCRQKFPANTNFPAMLAELYTQSDRMQDAIGVYDNILRTDTLNFDAWYEKGLLLEKKGDTPSAILALKKAYTIEPINTYGLELAHLYAENRDPASLLLVRRRPAQRFVPRSTGPLLYKGDLFFQHRTV